jgi:glutathione synthase/RimK-type ligase-like ATP-grasp enzyme
VAGVVINWGSGSLALQGSHDRIINKPEVVRNAVNKLRFMQDLAQLECTPPFSDQRAWAEREVQAGYTIVCREKLSGSGGEGIVVASKADQLVDAPLYVRYQKKTAEYRVHIVGDEVVVQRKARRNGIPDDQVNWQVRNLENGFVYVRGDVRDDMRTRASDLSRIIIGHLGLDFGAVDIIYHRRSDLMLALEVNTAPGLEGSTLQTYARGLLTLIRQKEA